MSSESFYSLEKYQVLYDKEQANNQVRANYKQQYIFFCVFLGAFLLNYINVENKQNFM